MYGLIETLILFAIAFAAVLNLTMCASSAECEHRWALSGMKSDYGLLQGCLIQRKDGTWVPDTNYREIME